MEIYPKIKSTIINGKILIIIYGIARNAKVCIFNNKKNNKGIYTISIICKYTKILLLRQ